MRTTAKSKKLAHTADGKRSTARIPKAAAETNAKHIRKSGLAADVARHQHDREITHGARAPPVVRLLDKTEVCQIAGVTYMTVWAWMRAGRFPRARVTGTGSNSKSMWLSSEVDAWLAGLPTRRLKGDEKEGSRDDEGFLRWLSFCGRSLNWQTTTWR